MCEPADSIQILREIPFHVAALEKAMTRGSHEAALVRCVYDSVRKDIECAVKQIEAERARKS